VSLYNIAQVRIGQGERLKDILASSSEVKKDILDENRTANSISEL